MNKKIDRQSSAQVSSENRFDHELAELKAALARLEASLAPTAHVVEKPRPQPQKRVRRRVSKPAAAIASSIPPPPAPAATTPFVTPSPASPSSVPPVVPIEESAPLAFPSLPTGTDLADPKNFGLMPPTTDLERGTASVEEYRQRLSEHLAFTTKLLHTSRVPAAVWREWRAFEKAVHERLRELASRPIEAAHEN